MSNPFYGLTTVYLPYSGNADANGNFTTILRPRPGFWFTGKLVNEVGAGFPAVRVSDGAIPLGFGRGNFAEVAGIVAPPSSSLVVDVLAAAANTIVKGSLVGVQGPDMQTIAAALTSSPNTVGAYISSPEIVLGSVTSPAPANPTSTTFPIPSGAVAVGFLVDTSGTNIQPQAVSIVGSQTSTTYINQSSVGGPAVGRGVQAALLGAPDTTVVCTVTWDGSVNQSKVWFLAFTTAPVEIPQQNAGQLFTVRADNTPPPWQKPRAALAFTTAPALATDFTIIPAIAAQTIYLFYGEFDTNSNAVTRFTLWDGPSVNGRQIGEFRQITAGTPPMVMDWKGMPFVDTNAALVGRLETSQVGATLNGTVGYSQV